MNVSTVSKKHGLYYDKHKQKECSKLPETFIINGQEKSDLSQIAEEFNTFFVGIGKSLSDSVASPVNNLIHTSKETIP